MVQVIDDRYAAHGEDYLVFRVHKDRDTDMVCGYLLTHSYFDDAGETKVVRTAHGVSAGEAFAGAVALAKQHGFNYLLVHDLDGLFPPEVRPQLMDAARQSQAQTG